MAKSLQAKVDELKELIGNKEVMTAALEDFDFVDNLLETLSDNEFDDYIMRQFSLNLLNAKLTGFASNKNKQLFAELLGLKEFAQKEEIITVFASLIL